MSEHYDGAIEKLIDEIENKDKRTRGAARAELARLRLAASEADALRAERDTASQRVDLMVEALRDQQIEWNGIVIKQQTSIVQLRVTVAEQARQIEAAREIIDVVARLGIGDGTFVRIGNDTWPKCSDVILARAWLAANAPAPEADHMPYFASAVQYRAALEQIESAWDESITDEHIAALKMHAIAERALNNADDEKNYNAGERTS